MGFPEYRPRRLRRNEKLRGMIRENELSVDHLVYPLFIKEGARRAGGHSIHARHRPALHRRRLVRN